MSKRQDASKIISATSQTAYERWEAPHVQTRQQQKQEQAGLITARQLEELQQQAYEEGFKLGKEEGYEKAFVQGLEKGQQQGKQEGLQQGLQEGRDETAQILKRFAQILQFLATPLEQLSNEVEDELLALSLATAKQIIRREINTDPGQIVAVIKEALAALPVAATKIKVYLHPADAEIARENLRISSAENENKEELWSVIDEPLLTRGGCRVETETSQIDASIETRVAEIAAHILGSERSADDDLETDKENIDREKTSAEEVNHEQ